MQPPCCGHCAAEFRCCLLVLREIHSTPSTALLILLNSKPVHVYFCSGLCIYRAVSIGRETGETLVPLCSHLSAKTCALKLCLSFNFAFFPFGHYSEGYEVCVCRVPLPTLGWCLPVPDPQQELHCPPLCWDKGGLSCPPALQPRAAPSRPEMQEEKQEVSFLCIIRCLGIRLESHLSGLRMRRQGTSTGVLLTHPKCFWVSFDCPLIQHAGWCSDKLPRDYHRANENPHV